MSQDQLTDLLVNRPTVDTLRLSEAQTLALDTVHKNLGLLFDE